VPRLLRAGTALGQRRAARVLRAGVDALLAAALAPGCAACRAALDAPSRGCLCPACLCAIRPASLAPWTSAHVDIGRAAGRYEGVLCDVIQAFKYEGRRSLAPLLAVLMREAGADLLSTCDFAVPVPLHPWRRVRRGFNQARDLAGRLGCPVMDALWRVRATAPQMTLRAGARRTNIRGAFILAPGKVVDNAVVVLVDDVRTTGATLDECARILCQAGAREVRALTVAVA
jgi:ComF family protein